MSSIVSGVSNLISSIFEIFKSIFDTILSLLQSVAAVFTTFLKSVFDLGKGLVEFLLSNIFLIVIIVGALFAFGMYQQRQGRSVASGKKSS